MDGQAGAQQESFRRSSGAYGLRPLTRSNVPTAKSALDHHFLCCCLDADNTKAVIGVLVCDALDKASKYLPIRRLGLDLHGACRSWRIGPRDSADAYHS